MAQQAADLTHGYVQEQVSQNDLNTDVILEQQGNIQAQVGNAANELRRQQELLKEKLDKLEVGQQAVAVAQHQQAAGFSGALHAIAQHVGHMAESAQMANMSFMEHLRHLRESQQKINPQQILNIFQSFHIPVTQNLQQIAVAYVRGQITEQQAHQLAIEDANPPSAASSSAGPAAAPMQPQAPLQHQSVGGMSQEQVRASSEPLALMNAEMQPMDHDIHDMGVVDTQMTHQRPKITAATVRRRRPLKYHKNWAQISAAVLKGQLNVQRGKQMLDQLKTAGDVFQTSKRRKVQRSKRAAEQAEATQNPNLNIKIRKKIGKTKRDVEEQQEPEAA
jgi:hypothetical protein